MRVFRRVAALMVGAVLMFVFLGACTPRPRRVVVVDAPAEVAARVRLMKPGTRCDWPKCGAEAYHLFVFRVGEVAVCNHHERETPASALVGMLDHIDEAWAIVEKV